MKLKKLIDWPYVLGLLLLPIIVTAIFLLVCQVIGWARYNPAYFTGEYLQRYEVPNPLLEDLETALREGDGALLAEVQGTRQVPADLEKHPNVRFLIYWHREGKYTDYLFMDMRNYLRYPQHLKVVNGRYVCVPEGAYYLADSGKWITTFGPLAEIYWLLVILFTLGMWLSRSMAAYRKEMFGKPPGVR